MRHCRKGLRLDSTGRSDSSGWLNMQIQRVLERHPIEVGTYGSSSAGSGETGPRAVCGGGCVDVPAGKYLINEPILQPPNVEITLHGSHLIEGPDFPEGRCLIEAVNAESAPDLFSRTSPKIIGRAGASLHGMGKALNGISYNLTNYGSIRDIIVEGFVGHGVSALQSQWLDFYRLICIGNGLDGVYLSDDPDTPAQFGCNDVTGVACMFEKNGRNGLGIGSSSTSTWVGLTTQFHENGSGVEIKPEKVSGASCNGHTFVGGHREDNKVHFNIRANGDNAPVGTVIQGGVSLITDGTGIGDGVDSFPVERLVINEGYKTVLIGGGSFNTSDMIATPATGGGAPTRAMLEQSERIGDMHVHDLFKPWGPANPDQPYACKEDGSLWEETLNPNNGSFAVSAIGGSKSYPKGATFGPDEPNV